MAECAFRRPLVNSVRNANGDIVLDFKPDKQPVLDPRVAYIMTNMMEGVMNYGTRIRRTPARLQRARGR